MYIYTYANLTSFPRYQELFVGFLYDEAFNLLVYDITRPSTTGSGTIFHLVITNDTFTVTNVPVFGYFSSSGHLPVDFSTNTSILINQIPRTYIDFCVVKWYSVHKHLNALDLLQNV